jgi:type IV fimbrial biogenesis protein FimT
MNPLPFTRLQATPLRHAQRGVSLVEGSIVLAITALLCGLAAPSFSGAIERRQLQGAAEQLRTDIHHARMLAVARNAPLRISFESSATASCYVVHSGSANQCSCASDGSAVCQGNAVAERAVRFAAGDPLAVRSNSRSVLIDPQRGTVSPTATVQVSARSGAAIHQIINIMGRVRSCSPAPALPGHLAC